MISTAWLFSAYSKEDELTCSEVLVSDDTLWCLCFVKIIKCARGVDIRVWALSGAILIKADIISYVDRRELFYIIIVVFALGGVEE